MTLIRGSVLIDGMFKKGCLSFDKEIQGFEVSIPSRDYLDFSSSYIVPGFIDLHNNGACGVSFVDEKSCEMEKFCLFNYSQGITSCFATFIGFPLDYQKKMLREFDFSKVEGIHLEGPFIDEEKKGVHRFTSEVSIDYLDEISRVIPESLRVMLTFSPALLEVDRLIAFAKERDWILSCGHSCATSVEARAAISLGAATCTHLFNAMTGLHHRDIGVAGAYLTGENTYVQLICDGLHVSSDMLRVVKKMKRHSLIAVVSDFIPAAGLKDGEYEWSGQRVVKRGLRAEIKGKLAGGVADTATVFRTLIGAGFSVTEIVEMRSLVPARISGLKKIGQLKKGYRSDIVVLSKDFMVQCVFKAGKRVYLSSR